MVLKNPDGTPYVAHTHNKLTTNQEVPDEVVFHNFKWNKEGENKKEETKYEPPKKVIPAPEPEIPKIEPKLELPEQLPEEKPEPQPKLNPKIKKVLIHCLLKGIKEKTNFYNEVVKTEGFIEKFSFEGVVVDEGDMEILIWTNAREITKGSIIYPSKFIHNDQPYHCFNWWQISDVQPKSGGYLARGVPSSLQPDFS